MDKINFQNLPNTTTPVNATNLNAMQTNIETEINSYKNTVLWENQSTSTFNAQIVDIAEGVNYDFFIIYAYRSYGIDYRSVCFILEKNSGGEIIYTDYYNNTIRVFSRRVDTLTTASKTTFDFMGCYINGTQNNDLLIPYKIVGCKYAE